MAAASDYSVLDLAYTQAVTWPVFSRSPFIQMYYAPRPWPPLLVPAPHALRHHLTCLPAKLSTCLDSCLVKRGESLQPRPVGFLICGLRVPVLCLAVLRTAIKGRALLLLFSVSIVTVSISRLLPLGIRLSYRLFCRARRFFLVSTPLRLTASSAPLSSSRGHLYAANASPSSTQVLRSTSSSLYTTACSAPFQRARAHSLDVLCVDIENPAPSSATRGSWLLPLAHASRRPVQW